MNNKTNTPKTSKALNISLWAAQGLAASGFIYGAGMKLFMPADALAAMWPWTQNYILAKATALPDLLAAAGLILPGILRTKPRLTVYAALGALLLMVSAIIFHVSRGEAQVIGFNIFMALLAAFIAWGRRRSY